MLTGGYWTRASALLSSTSQNQYRSSFSSSDTTCTLTSSIFHISSSVVKSSTTSNTFIPSSTSSTIIPTSTSTIVSPPTSSAPVSSALPTYPTSIVITTTEMPSLTTTILTSALTVTTFVTLASGEPPANVIAPIEGLNDCSQSIVFTNLANSQCNPADFPCVCNELLRLGVQGKVATACKPDELTQYVTFADQVCRGPNRVSTSASPLATTTNITSTPVQTRTRTSALIGTGTGISNASSIPGPFNNGSATTAGPIQLTTSNVVITTTDAAGQPATVTSQVVGPVGGSPNGPTSASSPEFTGAAVPEFGSARAGAFAGAMGFMGLVFAEL